MDKMDWQTVALLILTLLAYCILSAWFGGAP